MEGASSSCDIFTPDGSLRCRLIPRKLGSKIGALDGPAWCCVGRYRIDGSEMGLLGSGAHGIVRIAQASPAPRAAAAWVVATRRRQQPVVTTPARHVLVAPTHPLHLLS